MCLHTCSLTCLARCIWFHDINAPLTRNRKVLSDLVFKTTAGEAQLWSLCDSSLRKQIMSHRLQITSYCTVYTTPAGPLIWIRVVWLMTLLSFRPPHHPPRPRNRQQPHRHHDHPVQQHWERPVPSVHASGSQWAGVFAAEAQWRVGVHRPARHRQPHWGSVRENGLFGPAPARIFCTLGGEVTPTFTTVFQVYVATFSISGYAWASWRYRYKPFNPVLGETYESHREDRGFHYVSEQVIRGASTMSPHRNPAPERAVMLRCALFSG